MPPCPALSLLLTVFTPSSIGPPRLSHLIIHFSPQSKVHPSRPLFHLRWRKQQEHTNLFNLCFAAMTERTFSTAWATSQSLTYFPRILFSTSRLCPFSNPPSKTIQTRAFHSQASALLLSHMSLILLTIHTAAGEPASVPPNRDFIIVHIMWAGSQGWEEEITLI